MPAHIAIDLGEKHLFAVVCDRPGVRPLLLKNPLRGELLDGVTKNLDRGKHPEEAERLSRYASAVAEFLLEKCTEWNVRYIAVGNRGVVNPFSVSFAAPFKQGVFLLNFSLLLMEFLRFRCSLNGITVLAVDEKRTSIENGLSISSDRGRKTGGKLGRNSFVTSSKVSIHRDVNGALNIGKKTFGDGFSARVRQSKLWDRPEEVLIPYFYPHICLFPETGTVRERLGPSRDIVCFVKEYLALSATWKVLDFLEAKFQGKRTGREKNARKDYSRKYVPVEFTAFESVWRPVFEERVLKVQKMINGMTRSRQETLLEGLRNIERKQAAEVSWRIPEGLLSKGLYCIPGYGNLTVTDYESYISLPRFRRGQGA
jgi:hypothetical protein